MRYLDNKDGIALVTSLMFTVMALVMCMSLLYMITSGIKTSGAVKQYRTALDAAYGGTDIVAKDLIAAAFSFRNLSGATYTNQMKNTYMANLLQPNVSNCLKIKLTKPRSQWGSCADATSSPKTNTDISFDLHASSGSPFTVYSKIVDTMERKFQVLQSYSGAKGVSTVTMAGNTDLTTTSIEFGSTTDGSGVSVPHYPYVYRIEVQGERRQNSSEKSNLSVLYAY
jgi:hypothetical protein